ncbi:hypothetical protein SAMN05444365_102525 [Micromonospora pattaloongensis]|uniref:Ferritin-like domain-containing protein n=1 Tax=Micromonospora pattaloongensis TaxID=405436 RepID=A0A1H3KJX9_9ACTN|nr:hypothetical protein [Micromonospora pattaloongensis]SDY52310.1 hypothetical protein SAMN05444365_102525 [Micromonospora pattaloongensis]
MPSRNEPAPTTNSAPDGDVRRLSRRGLLRITAGATVTVPAAALTGCGLFDRDPDTPPAPDPLAPLLAGALDLAARHEAAAAARPELADRLAPIAQAHRAHAAELARVIGAAAATPTATAGPTSAGPGGADDVRGMLADLRAAERAGQAAAVQACRAAPAARAALLGSIAAARATHLEVLT